MVERRVAIFFVLSLLFIVLLIGSIHACPAEECKVTFIEPTQGWYGNNTSIEWEYSSSCHIQPDQDLSFDNGVLERIISTIRNTWQRRFYWDPTEEGNYRVCIDTELIGDGWEVEGCSDEFKVDLTPPEIFAEDMVCEENDTIVLTASASDSLSGINYPTWKWTIEGIIYPNREISYLCKDAPSTKIANVEVIDNAGNLADKKVTIKINRPSPYCGDGEINLGSETCDDGNNYDNDGCSANCIIEESISVCGNDIPETGEECDEGSNNGKKCDNSNHDCEYCSTSCNIVKLKGDKNDHEKSHEKISSSGYKLIGDFCVNNWDCSGWSGCENGLRTRICKDKNNCGNKYNKPTESTGCAIISKSLVEEEKKNNFILVFIMLITLIIFLVVLANLI